jgi:hypothetical protein
MIQKFSHINLKHLSKLLQSHVILLKGGKILVFICEYC